MTRTPVDPRRKWPSLGILLLAEVAVMSLWFSSAAILPDMLADHDVPPFAQAALASGVQIGFVIGALAIAISGLAYRVDPRGVFILSALVGALANALLLIVPVGGSGAIAARVLVGVAMAGVYPVGMKIAVGWGSRDRGLLVGLLVGALTIGSASPHLVAAFGASDWRFTVAATSLISAVFGSLVVFASLGPHHARTARPRIDAMARAWTNKRIRYACLGYLGHMFELYVMWAWIGVALAASFAQSMDADAAALAAKLTAFAAIAAGGLACIPAGSVADRLGRAEVTIAAMAVSGLSAVLVALSLGGPVWLTIPLVVLWGLSIVPDSAQFSALVADASPDRDAGSMMTFQTALGFSLTFVTVQVAPLIATRIGWSLVLGGLALGPAFGIMAMVAYRRL